MSDTARIREFIQGNGYEIVRMSDGERSAVPMDTSSVLAAFDALVADVDLLRDALRRYGQHERRCAVWRVPWLALHYEPAPPCDCGLADALREDT